MEVGKVFGGERNISTMANEIKAAFERYRSDEILIYTHADHDGLCAAVALNYLFRDIQTTFSQSFKPREIPRLHHKRLLVICDLQLGRKMILNTLKSGLEVINLDHHEIIELEHSRYCCLNPKKVYGKQFISSSGMVWKLFKPREIGWVLATGSVGDLAIEDVKDLFEVVAQDMPELIPPNISLYDSKIFELAQILLMSFKNPNEGFNLLKRGLSEGYETFFKSRLYEAHLKKQERLNKFLMWRRDKIIEDDAFVVIDSSNQPYRGSYCVKLNLDNKDDKIYVEYSNGRLFFRNFFGGEDVRNLAKLFGGGGAHSRTGGAITKKSFSETIDLIKSYFNTRQKRLIDF